MSSVNLQWTPELREEFTDGARRIRGREIRHKNRSKYSERVISAYKSLEQNAYIINMERSHAVFLDTHNQQSISHMLNSNSANCLLLLNLLHSHTQLYLF